MALAESAPSRSYPLLMSRCRVCFDGKWQETFYDEDEAITWAKEVGDTGRLAYVVKSSFPLPAKLVAVFPEERRELGEMMWSLRAGGAGGGSPPAGG